MTQKEGKGEETMMKGKRESGKDSTIIFLIKGRKERKKRKEKEKREKETKKPYHNIFDWSVIDLSGSASNIFKALFEWLTAEFNLE